MKCVLRSIIFSRRAAARCPAGSRGSSVKFFHGTHIRNWADCYEGENLNISCMKNIFRKVKDSITGQDKTLENRWLNHVQSYPAYQSKPDLGFFDCHLVTDNFLRKIGTKIPSLRNISGIFLPPPIQAKSFKIWEMEGFKNKTNLPVSINGSPVHENFLHFHPKYSSRNSFITCVQNGFFHGSDHTLFDNKLTPIDWEAPYWALRYSLPGSMFRTRFSSPINLKGKTLVLSAPGADSNIWHFFYDSLP